MHLSSIAVPAFYFRYYICTHIYIKSVSKLVNGLIISNFHGRTWLNCILLGRSLAPQIFILISKKNKASLKVIKFQKHFSWNLHWPKNARNIWQNSDLATFVFERWSFKKKYFLRFTDLYHNFWLYEAHLFKYVTVLLKYPACSGI